MKPKLTFSYEDTEFAGLPTSANETPHTNRDVLLERWAKDTEAMASRMIGYDEAESKFFTTNMDGGITNRYEHVRLALEAQVAYLNSAVEVGN